MKKIYLLSVGLVLLGQVGCGSTDREGARVVDDGALVPVESESGEILPGELEPKRAKRGLRRKRSAPDTEVEPGPDGLATEGADRGDDEGIESKAKKALEKAKVHYELGDYDFAADELSKIGQGSPYYLQAQLLLKQLR